MLRVITIFLLLSQLLYAVELPVKFSGNHTIDDGTLYRVIGLEQPLFFEFWKEKKKIDPQKIPALLPLIENFYKSHGFYHAKASSHVQDDQIIIHIKEDQPIKVANLSTISPLNIESFIPFHEGERFDPEAFVKSKEAIKKFYADHQFCNALLHAKAFVDIEKNLAYIVYDITPNAPCQFGHISINAPKNVDPAIIASFLYFQEGDPYTTELIRRSYQEIYTNEGVDRVTIDDSKHYENRVPVDVTVSLYPKPIHVTAGTGFSSDEGVNLLMGIKHRNFFGNLKTTGIEARYSQIRSYIRTLFGMPLKNHNRLGGNLGLKQELYDGYDERALFARINLQHALFPYLFHESIFYDHITTTNSIDPINFPNGTLHITSLQSSWSIEKRDALIDPSKGYKLHTELSGSIKSPISDASYYKILLSGLYHHPLPWGVLSLRLKHGTIKRLQGHIPPSYRFYAGGMNSNRAYSYRQLGATNSSGNPIGAFSITEGTVEFRMPLVNQFKAVIFSDITYLGQQTLPNYQQPFVAVGPGIRYQTPIGPIALDIGFDLNDFNRYAIHFHIGELF